MINSALAGTEGRAYFMSHKVHPAAKHIAKIIESSEGFRQLTGGPEFSGKLKASMKGTKVYQPGQDDSGFGGRPRFTLGSDFGTVKLDSNSYSKVIAGKSHAKHSVANREKSAAHPPRQYLARAHKVKVPKVPENIAEKYASHKIRAKALVKARRNHQGSKVSPQLALFYASGPGALSLRPQYGFRFQSPREAYVALKRGEISKLSMVQFANGRDGGIFAPASSLAIFLQPTRS